MAENQYSIKFQIEKGDISSVSEDMKKLMSSFQDVSKSLKPLADSFSSAFGPKTLESLNKITSIFSNLERTLDSLSNKTDRFGSTIERVAGGRGMQQISGAQRGVIFDQFGRPITTEPETAAAAALGGGPSKPLVPFADVYGGGGGLGAMARAAGKMGVPGAGALAEIAGGVSPMMSGVGMAIGGIATAYNYLYDQNYRYKAAVLEGQRMGRASAMAGRPGERYVMGGVGSLTSADELRADAGVVGSVLGYGLAGAAAGSFIPGVGTVVGGVVGAGVGLISGFSGRQETLNRIRQQKLNLNRELGQGVDMSMDIVNSMETADLMYGAGTASAILGGSNYGGLDRRTSLLTRMARSGIRMGAGDTAGFDRMMALENRYNLGALSGMIMRTAPNMASAGIGGFESIIAGRGYGDADQMAARGMIMEGAAGAISGMGVYGTGAQQNLTDLMFSYASPFQGKSAEFQQAAAADTFSRRGGVMRSGFGRQVMFQSLFSKGIKNPFAAQGIMNSLEAGNVARAIDIAKSQNVNLSEADLNGVVSNAFGGAQKILGAMGMPPELVGAALTTSDTGIAAIENIAAGRGSGYLSAAERTGARRTGQRFSLEDQGPRLEGRDPRAVQAAEAQMTQYQEALAMASVKFNEFKDIVAKAGNDFNDAVLKGLKQDTAFKERESNIKTIQNSKMGSPEYDRAARELMRNKE